MIIPDKYKKFFSAAGGGAIGMQNLLELIPPVTERGNLRGYHVLMTSPFTYSNPYKTFEMNHTALLTAELSARLWWRFNGSISLITDETGFDYIKRTSLSKAYDEILPILDRRNFGIVPTKYWASGKIQALTKISAPCVILDMDILLWRKLTVTSDELLCTHTEPLSLQCYPSPEFFHTDADYSYPSDWDFTVEPLNTAVLYIAEDSFKDYYAEQSIRFMYSEKESPDNGVVCMVFAEQRILAMCAAARGITPKLLLDYYRLSESQTLLTHIWSAKKIIEMVPDLSKIFIELCEEKLNMLRSDQDGKKARGLFQKII